MLNNKETTDVFLSGTVKFLGMFTFSSGISEIIYVKKIWPLGQPQILIFPFLFFLCLGK